MLWGDLTNVYYSEDSYDSERWSVWKMFFTRYAVFAEVFETWWDFKDFVQDSRDTRYT